MLNTKLVLVVQKEKARPENSAFKSEVEDMSSSPTKGGEASEVEQTAFRLYYKEHSSAVESIHKDGDHSEKKKTPTSQEISERVNNMWCGLGPDEREKYLKQARELTQIKLPPQLIKKKPLLNSAYSSGATSQITADQTKGDVGHKKSKFGWCCYYGIFNVISSFQCLHQSKNSFFAWSKLR